MRDGDGANEHAGKDTGAELRGIGATRVPFEQAPANELPNFEKTTKTSTIIHADFKPPTVSA